MTRDEFERAGRLLFGESWIGPLGVRTRALLDRALNRVFEP